jgi:hypothetical protein
VSGRQAIVCFRLVESVPADEPDGDDSSSNAPYASRLHMVQ